MVYFGEKQQHPLTSTQTPVTLTAQRNPNGGIELVRKSDDGTTVYFDQPRDAIRRWNAWVLSSPHRPDDPDGLLIELVESHISKIADFLPARDEPGTQTAPPPVRGRVVCLADTIDVSYADTDRRSEPRIPPGEVSWLLGVRILYGDHARVLNISSSAILIETVRELANGTTIPIELFGKQGALPVAGQVVRSRPFIQGDIIWYETACRFKRSLDLQGLIPRFRNQ